MILEKYERDAETYVIAKCATERSGNRPSAATLLGGCEVPVLWLRCTYGGGGNDNEKIVYSPL